MNFSSRISFILYLNFIYVCKFYGVNSLSRTSTCTYMYTHTCSVKKVSFSCHFTIGESPAKNTSILGPLLIIASAITILIIIIVVFIRSKNLWKKRHSGHAEQHHPVRLVLEPILPKGETPHEPNQELGEIGALLEVSSTRSLNTEPDDIPLPSHSSGSVVYIESPLDPQHSSEGDRLRNEELVQANRFQAPVVQQTLPTPGPPPVLNPGPEPIQQNALAPIAENHMAEPPVDHLPAPLPETPQQPVEPPLPVSPSRQDAPDGGLNPGAVLSAAPRRQQAAPDEETNSDGTSVPVEETTPQEQAGNGQETMHVLGANTGGIALSRTDNAFSVDFTNLPNHNAQIDNSQERLISAFSSCNSDRSTQS